MAVKKVEINYTPEELSEINRIINVITDSDVPQPQEIITKPVDSEKINSSSRDIEDIESEMPSDLDIDFEDAEPEEKTKSKIRDEELFDEDVHEIGHDEIEDISELEDGEIQDLEEIMPLSDSDLSFIDETDNVDIIGEVSEITDEPEEKFDEIHDEKPRKSAETFSLEKDEDFDIPDLDALPVSESVEIPEAETEDIPDIDLGDLDLAETPEKEMHDEIEPIEDIPDSFDDLEEPEKAPDEVGTSTLDEIDSFTDDFADIEDIPDAFEESSPVKKSTGTEKITDEFKDNPQEDDTLTIEPLDDDIIDQSEEQETPKPSKKSKVASPEIDLSEKDVTRLKKAIILFNPGVRQVIRETVINELLPSAEMKKLVDMIITGKSEDSIHGFLEKKLKRKIDLVNETSQKRRVIASRPEYSLEGRERQKKLVKATGIFGASFLVAFLVTILSYQFIYKPYMAKKLIRDGVALILNSGHKGERFDRKKNYDEAEKIFSQVDEEYIKNFLYGYNEYARAYLTNKDYPESLEKLNKAYNLDKTNLDTLNNLGYFYAKSKEYFETVKPNIQKWYFTDKKEMQGINSSLDLSISFYRRALLVNKENITSLVGIGNAYFYQGQYLNAKKYYEDILKVDPDSVVGYSGLLNLYIDRDSFPLTATVHAELREKDMLKELPSPLLSKLAGYYLDKRAKGDSNVRIDYGVVSPRLIDSNDNTDPAILEVLKALNDRNPDYPQLHIQFARFHLAKHNLIEMERYLDKALALEPEYYSALQLKGEYYYNTKEPVKAYKCLKNALEKFSYQPEFTKEEFYKETENLGKTNIYLGNIFYYYFDKVKNNEGALSDEIADNDKEKMDNYSSAQKYYLSAMNYYTENQMINFKASELYYNLGRIHYLKGEYSLALNLWLHLYDDFVKSPELMLSLGNAFYNSGNGTGPGNYEAAKGEYLKLISVMEYEADKIKVVNLSKESHVKLFQTLSSAYNNLGAVYQKTEEHQKRDLAYWKAIDYGQKMNQENEYARVNLARSNRDAEPLLDKFIPFSIDIYREDMRN